MTKLPGFLCSHRHRERIWWPYGKNENLYTNEGTFRTIYITKCLDCDTVTHEELERVR